MAKGAIASVHTCAQCAGAGLLASKWFKNSSKLSHLCLHSCCDRHSTMTTNIHDLQNHRLAVDSRWSVDLRNTARPKVIFVDDVDYQKIVCTPDHIAMFAGYADIMNDWKLAIFVASLSGRYSFRKLPTKGIALLLLDAKKGYLFSSSGVRMAGWKPRC